ncbi:MAG: hypothetical protein OEV94_00045 [Deltaproteobacteria bacterium]|nr:hypothetical protein [Deltaproteobacteria bacterium]
MTRPPRAEPPAHSPASPLAAMPELYAQNTTPREQQRHAQVLARLAAPGGPSEMVVEGVVGEDGGWQAEIITHDWDEPGLLDKIFEAILLCIRIPGGVVVKRARIFTGLQGQVVNLLELVDYHGQPLTPDNGELVLERLRDIQKGERTVLETIENLPFTSLIPLLTEYPLLDNDRSEHYTYLELPVKRVSNRFTSVLFHFLARSEFQVNVQLAEFSSGTGYRLWLWNKEGSKLADTHFSRVSMIWAFEAINRMVMRFNLHYIRLAWRRRAGTSDRQYWMSRPNPSQAALDVEAIEQLAALKGFAGLEALVEGGLLDSRDFFFLKKFSRFCQRHQDAITSLKREEPTPEIIALCREYFDLRRQSALILGPLFHQLWEMEPARPWLSDSQRMEALCRPLDPSGYAMDTRQLIYRTNSPWITDPARALEPFRLMARTGSPLREDLQTAVEASLEGWTPDFLESRRETLGKEFLEVLDESIRQGTTGRVFRGLRQVGLLQRYLPGFSQVAGLIHVNQDHVYTVDEHTIVAMEAVTGLGMLAQALPKAGKSRMRADYAKIQTPVGLSRFVRKYALEIRVLQSIPAMRDNPSTVPFFNLVDEVRANSLEYLVEVNLLEHSFATCMTALNEAEKIRAGLDTLLAHYQALPFSAKRMLALTALLHDLMKPHQDHGPRLAPHIGSLLNTMGLPLSPADADTVAWLVAHHLDLAGLLQRMGKEGDQAIHQYVREAHDPERVRLLILFTYADRLAVFGEPARNAHNALVLSDLLRMVEG